VPPSPPGYVFTGVVVDSGGTPVASAELSDGQRSVFADASGRFRIERTAGGPEMNVSVSRERYERIEGVSIKEGENRITMRRILSVELLNVWPRIAVGQRHGVSARIRFDSGEIIESPSKLDMWSTDSRILRGGNSSFMYQEGVSPGTAGLVGSYWGVTTTFQVEVFKP
jgi:hypothetical protein